ncbi:hypothetical protein NP233_g4289 [Leucocoprinus birnbaumii]|uniref:DUF3533 domain-containing protein n=1 Tax=Leucocoprinus birnbaumii TaxID=56174 RepID=A0AAD5VUY6_9AGAR|nr:hypothetical protein NP233_g4289 [Leucocoprinus birnbaumii]
MPDNSKIEGAAAPHTAEQHENQMGAKLSERASSNSNSASGHLVYQNADNGPALYQHTFFSSDPAVTVARRMYLKFLAVGMVASTFVIFGIFPILYGSFYKTPARSLPGWIVDFDGGVVGQAVTTGLSAPNPLSFVTWSVMPASQFPGGVDEVVNQVLDYKTWIAVTVNPGASSRLTAALASPNASYDGSQAISVYGVEARNQAAFDGILLPSTQLGLTLVSTQFATQSARMMSNSSDVPQLLSTSPQTLVTPIYFKIFNLRPFDQPVATVVVFVGLLFVLILSFFIVLIGFAAREKTNIRRLLTYRSLVQLRLATSFFAYFILSLFDSLLALAFTLNVNKKFGHAGFMVFWMVNFLGMCTMGLAMEGPLSLLGPPSLPFFFLIWIMANVAVCVSPIEVLPIIYRYGYGMPFYAITVACRTIIFDTKNTLGLQFGILIAWTVFCALTAVLFGYIRRRRDIKETRREAEAKVE